MGFRLGVTIFTFSLRNFDSDLTISIGEETESKLRAIKSELAEYARVKEIQ
jgi:hypothetical protein